MKYQTCIFIIFSLFFGTIINDGSLDNGFTGEKVANVQQSTILPNGQWNTFYFLNAGSPIYFTMSPDAFAYLTITDLYCRGDSFAVYVNGSLLGISPTVATGCEGSTSDPNYTYLNGSWSSRQFLLISGSKNVTVVPVTSPYSAGRAAIKLEYLL